MGTLQFVFPISGREVDTGIVVDLVSFGSLRGEELGCPQCLEVHQLSQLKAWITNEAPPNRPTTLIVLE